MSIYFKLTLSGLLSILSIILYIKDKSKMRLFLMLGMLMSSFGDVFMVDSPFSSIVLGAGGFIIAHLLYAYAFFIASNKKIKRNKGFLYGIIFMIISALTLEILAFTIPVGKNTTFALLLLVYILIIGIHLVMNFQYTFSKGGLYLLSMFGVALFYITDLWIFNDMLNIEHFSIKLVWYFYPIAQALILIFSKKKGEVNN